MGSPVYHAEMTDNTGDMNRRVYDALSQKHKTFISRVDGFSVHNNVALLLVAGVHTIALHKTACMGHSMSQTNGAQCTGAAFRALTSPPGSATLHSSTSLRNIRLPSLLMSAIHSVENTCSWHHSILAEGLVTLSF